MATTDATGASADPGKKPPHGITRLTAVDLRRLEQAFIRDGQPGLHASAYGLRIEQVDPVRGYAMVAVGLAIVFAYLVLGHGIMYDGSRFWYAAALFFLFRLAVKMGTGCTLVVEPEQCRVSHRRVTTTTQIIRFRDIQDISVRKHNFFGWPQCSVLVYQRNPVDECVVTTQGRGTKTCIWTASLLEHALRAWRSRQTGGPSIEKGAES